MIVFVIAIFLFVFNYIDFFFNYLDEARNAYSACRPPLRVPSCFLWDDDVGVRGRWCSWLGGERAELTGSCKP